MGILIDIHPFLIINLQICYAQD